MKLLKLLAIVALVALVTISLRRRTAVAVDDADE